MLAAKQRICFDLRVDSNHTPQGRLRHIIVKIITSLGLLLALAACSPSPAPQTHELASGKRVELISTTKILVPNDNPMVAFNYRTELSIDNTAALAREADEVWSSLRSEAESSGFSKAYVKATKSSVGLFLTKSKSYSFLYVRQPDGQWHRDTD